MFCGAGKYTPSSAMDFFSRSVSLFNLFSGDDFLWKKRVFSFVCYVCILYTCLEVKKRSFCGFRR
ncbi:hypothetical protein Fmac_002804 [Flemingia macrophylla]|uniref:Uncharacterized protein n=1 Tax=Flemingia macrophylla TaxID=520843 RepID=A0ABD1NL04_9FABA